MHNSKEIYCGMDTTKSALLTQSHISGALQAGRHQAEVEVISAAAPDEVLAAASVHFFVVDG